MSVLKRLNIFKSIPKNDIQIQFYVVLKCYIEFSHSLVELVSELVPMDLRVISNSILQFLKLALSIIWKQFQKYTKTLKKIFPTPKLLLVFSYSSIWIPKYKENKDFWNVNYKKRRNFDIQGITKKLYLRP